MRKRSMPQRPACWVAVVLELAGCTNTSVSVADAVSVAQPPCRRRLGRESDATGPGSKSLCSPARAFRYVPVEHVQPLEALSPAAKAR